MMTELGLICPQHFSIGSGKQTGIIEVPILHVHHILSIIDNETHEIMNGPQQTAYLAKGYKSN